MLAKISSWISKLLRLVLVTRTTFEALAKTTAEIEALLEQYKEKAAQLEQNLQDANFDLKSAKRDLEVVTTSLLSIREQETPVANATTKRMARMADQALKELGAA